MNLYEVQIREGGERVADSLYDDLELATFEAERRSVEDGVRLRIVLDREAGRESSAPEIFYTTDSDPAVSEAAGKAPPRESGGGWTRVRRRHIAVGALALAAAVLWILSPPA